MNSLFDIFSGIGILDCISFQKDESEHEVHLRSAKESTPCGRDNYVLSTLTSLDDEFTEGCCGEDKWKWPEGSAVPSWFSEDPSKVDLLRKVQTEISQMCLSLQVNYFARAKKTNLNLDNSMLLRYLEVAQWVDPPSPPAKPTAERIIETIDWRISVPMPIQDRSLISKELATGKFYVNGLSKDGRPVVYLRISRENTWDPRCNLLSLVYTIERAIATMGPNVKEMVAVVDCAGVGMMNAPSTAFVKLAIEVLGKHYPKRNGQIFIVNVSSIFYMIWNIVSLSLTEVTKQKIKILANDPSEMAAIIGEYINLDVLLSEYGGKNSEEFNLESYLNTDPNFNN